TVRARRNRTLQLQLPRNYGLGEITFADKIRDDENLVNRFIRKKKSCVAQARFLFPKGALDIGKNVPALNFARVSPSRRARIRIHGSAVTDNQKRTVVVHNHTEPFNSPP